MNRRQFLVALAVLVVLAAAGVAVVVSERSGWKSADSRAGQKVIPGLKIVDVAEIVIRDAAGELHLARTEAGWTVRERAGFAADIDRVAELLVKVAEMKIVQSEPLPTAQRARLDLIEPKGNAGPGTLLELKDTKGADLARLLLGKKVMKSAPPTSLARAEGEASGRYLTAGNEAGTLLVVGEPLAQVESKAEPWLVKELVRADGARTITSSKDGKVRWKVTRESESLDWKFADGAKPDLQKATDLSSSFGWVNLVDVVADPAKVDTGLARAVVVNAETFDGLTYTLRIGNRVGDNYYVGVAVSGEPRKGRAPAKGEKAEEKEKRDKEFEERRAKLLERLAREKTLDKWTYLVSKNVVEPLLRERNELMPEKKAKKG